MIDGRCKRREALSRAALIGRALDFPFPQAPLGGRPGRGPAAWGRTSSESCCAAPRARRSALGVNAPRGPAAMAGGERPEPSRTRKLSPRAPMVLRSSPWESGSPPSRERHSEGSALWGGPLRSYTRNHGPRVPRRGARPAAYRGGARSGRSWFSCHGLRFPNLIRFGMSIYVGWLNTLDSHFRR